MKKQVVLGICIVVIGMLASLPLVITTESWRVTSPDGRFYAVVTSPIWQSYVSVMPGGGSDKSGYVTVYTREGKSCGRAPVEMVWMIQDMEWSETNAELKLVAEWDLINHTVKSVR
jgi:hypothetical protein